MSGKVYEQFQTTHTDPEQPVTLPSRIAEKLAVRPDYKPSRCRTATDQELETYNDILGDKGKEAADKWLNEQWQ